MKSEKDATKVVHGGELKKRPYDTLTQGIYASATFAFTDTQELRDHFEGRIDREEYGRYGNPTVKQAEKKIAALDDAGDAALFSTGMAAICSTLLSMVKQGQHIVLTNDCYRRTRQFISSFLGKFGIEHSLVKPGDYQALEKAIIPGKTKLIFSESPTNPYLRVVDFSKLAQIKNKFKSVKIIVDSTFATPINQKPLNLGADLVIHSCTKYLAGHNDILGGVVCGPTPLISALKDFRGVIGPLMDAHSAYFLIRGLKTLELRVKRQNENGLEIARWLEKHSKIERVFYPGLPSHPDYEHASREMSGFAGVISFLVKGDLDQVSKFIDHCKIPYIAPSLGGVESLIEQPALMSFYELTTDQRKEVGIYNNLVRMAVGIEDKDDLIADLEQALKAI